MLIFPLQIAIFCTVKMPHVVEVVHIASAHFLTLCHAYSFVQFQKIGLIKDILVLSKKGSSTKTNRLG